MSTLLLLGSDLSLPAADGIFAAVRVSTKLRRLAQSCLFLKLLSTPWWSVLNFLLLFVHSVAHMSPSIYLINVEVPVHRLPLSI